MKDLVVGFFSTVLHMDMTDHHEYPFATLLLIACFIGGIIGFTILRFIGNEQRVAPKGTYVDE